MLTAQFCGLIRSLSDGSSFISRPVKNPAPPGIFFTAAAFDKYSVSERLKQARVSRVRQKPITKVLANDASLTGHS